MTYDKSEPIRRATFTEYGSVDMQAWMTELVMNQREQLDLLKSLDHHLQHIASILVWFQDRARG
jgi:hypothetical protein